MNISLKIIHHKKTNKVYTAFLIQLGLNKYTEAKSLKPSSKGRSTMTKGGQTIWKERIEIVQYTIANDKDYQKAMAQYKVSYGKSINGRTLSKRTSNY